MTPGSRWLCAALLIAATAPLALPAQAPPAADSAIDPAAVQAMQRARDHLRSLRSFEVRADTTIQLVLDDGAKVDTLNHVTYEYRAPDHLFVNWQSDRHVRRLFFDGRNLTVYAPRAGYYAQVAQAGSVAQVLGPLAEQYGVVMPIADLFYWASPDAPQYDVRSAQALGYARIAGVDTDQYLFRGDDVDWQVWIQRGDQPFIRKIAITDRADPAQPTTTALLQWNPNVSLGDDRFAFTPPSEAHPIAFATLPTEESR